MGVEGNSTELSRMKISEVRSVIEKYSPDQLRLIISELYKAIPKAIKEEKVAAPVIGPTDKVTDDTLPPEDREKKIRESMGPSVRKDK